MRKPKETKTDTRICNILHIRLIIRRESPIFARKVKYIADEPWRKNQRKKNLTEDYPK